MYGQEWDGVMTAGTAVMTLKLRVGRWCGKGLAHPANTQPPDSSDSD